MNADNARSNYTEDRSSNFKHHVPSGLIPPSAPTVQEYVNAEKSKQMSKMRDWYLESKKSESTDKPALRSSFANSRNFSSPSPVQELDHHKGYLIAGSFIAAVIGGLMLFVHF